MTGIQLKIFSFALIAVVFIADQFSKWAFTQLLISPNAGLGSSPFFDWLQNPHAILPFMEFQITSFFNIVMVWNYGVSFGFFNDKSLESTYFLIALALVIAFGLMLWLLDTKDRVIAIGLSLAIGGAFGNVFDRFRFGAVIDFMDFHAYGLHWPAFNLADSCIMIGIGLVIVKTFLTDEKKNNERANAPHDKKTI